MLEGRIPFSHFHYTIRVYRQLIIAELNEGTDVEGVEHEVVDHWYLLLVMIVIIVGILPYLRSGSKKDGVEE